MNVSTWYTAILVGILGLIIGAKFGNDNGASYLAQTLTTNIAIQIALAVAILIFGGASAWSILYSHQRHDEIRDYMEGLEPDWGFTPSKRCWRPRHWIYVTQVLLVAFTSYLIILSENDLRNPFGLLDWKAIGIGMTFGVLVIFCIRREISELFDCWRNKHSNGAEPALIYLEHRKQKASNSRFWTAFRSNRDVVFITIKSRHTRDRLKEMLESSRIKLSSLRILTLDPESPDVIFQALARHINEPVGNCITDAQDAYNDFRELASKYSFVHVHRYNTLPVMQGIIVEGKFAQIELLTYHSNPEQRSAIVVTQKEAPDSLKLITERFNKLWEESVP